MPGFTARVVPSARHAPSKHGASFRPARLLNGPVQAATARANTRHRIAQSLQPGVGDEIEVAPRWGTREANRPFRLGHRIEIEQRADELDGTDPVEQRVMDLLHEAHRTVGQTVDEPQLPQRPAPVEHLHVELAAPGEHLLAAAG